MKTPTAIIVLAIVAIATPLHAADDVTLDIKKSIKITWQSKVGKNYQLMSTTDVGLQNYQTLGVPLDGTGGNITVFFDTEVDQKVFFRVEEVDGSASQATAMATVVNGFITAITVLNPGVGYTEPPLVTISDSTGSGAVATASISDSSVTSITVMDAGSGYSSTPTITIDPPPSKDIVKKVSDLEKIAKKIGVAFTKPTGPISHDLSGVDLSGAHFVGNGFATWTLANANFKGAIFDIVESSGANYSGADLRDTNINSGNYSNCNFTGADLANAQFHGAPNFNNADFTNANLFNSTFNPGGHTGVIYNNTTMPDGSIRTD